jgi:hypothetical protein
VATSIERSSFLNRRVVVAFFLESLGYAALLAVVPHSDPSALAEAFQAVPTPILLPVATVAIPAAALVVAVGAVLSLVGFSATSIPPLLFARGDVLFLGSAYAVGVMALRLWNGGRISAGRTKSS